MTSDPLKTRRLAFIILAHNEAAVIERAVDSIRQTLSPCDALYLVADHCSDDTAIRACNAGAEVFTRGCEPFNGKGAALAWFVDHYRERLLTYAALVILDADDRISADFSQLLRARLSDSEEVIQCFIQPADYERTPLGTLIALSELLEQSVHERIRSMLGWPIRLRGTGMAISPGALLQVGDQLQTEVEDIALSLLFASRGIKSTRLDTAIVYDPKPEGSLAASRQRARWFRGQWIALWHYRHDVLRIIAQGPPGWSLLGALFGKPRWLIFVIKIILALLCSHWPWLAALLWAAVSIDLLTLAIGIGMLKEKRMFLKAIFHFPTFVFMWLRSFFLAAQRSEWLRTRE